MKRRLSLWACLLVLLFASSCKPRDYRLSESAASDEEERSNSYYLIGIFKEYVKLFGLSPADPNLEKAEALGPILNLAFESPYHDVRKKAAVAIIETMDTYELGRVVFPTGQGDYFKSEYVGRAFRKKEMLEAFYLSANDSSERCALSQKADRPFKVCDSYGACAFTLDELKSTLSVHVRGEFAAQQTEDRLIADIREDVQCLPKDHATSLMKYWVDALDLSLDFYRSSTYNQSMRGKPEHILDQQRMASFKSGAVKLLSKAMHPLLGYVRPWNPVEFNSEKRDFLLEFCHDLALLEDPKHPQVASYYDISPESTASGAETCYENIRGQLLRPINRLQALYVAAQIMEQANPADRRSYNPDHWQDASGQNPFLARVNRWKTAYFKGNLPDLWPTYWQSHTLSAENFDMRSPLHPAILFEALGIGFINKLRSAFGEEYFRFMTSAFHNFPDDLKQEYGGSFVIVEREYESARSFVDRYVKNFVGAESLARKERRLFEEIPKFNSLYDSGMTFVEGLDRYLHEQRKVDKEVEKFLGDNPSDVKRMQFMYDLSNPLNVERRRVQKSFLVPQGVLNCLDYRVDNSDLQRSRLSQMKVDEQFVSIRPEGGACWKNFALGLTFTESLPVDARGVEPSRCVGDDLTIDLERWCGSSLDPDVIAKDFGSCLDSQTLLDFCKDETVNVKQSIVQYGTLAAGIGLSFVPGISSISYALVRNLIMASAYMAISKTLMAASGLAPLWDGEKGLWGNFGHDLTDGFIFITALGPLMSRVPGLANSLTSGITTRYYTQSASRLLAHYTLSTGAFVGAQYGMEFYKYLTDSKMYEQMRELGGFKEKLITAASFQAFITLYGGVATGFFRGDRPALNALKTGYEKAQGAFKGWPRGGVQRARSGHRSEVGRIGQVRSKLKNLAENTIGRIKTLSLRQSRTGSKDNKIVSEVELNNGKVAKLEKPSGELRDLRQHCDSELAEVELLSPKRRSTMIESIGNKIQREQKGPNPNLEKIKSLEADLELVRTLGESQEALHAYMEQLALRRLGKLFSSGQGGSDSNRYKTIFARAKIQLREGEPITPQEWQQYKTGSLAEAQNSLIEAMEAGNLDTISTAKQLYTNRLNAGLTLRDRVFAEIYWKNR